jgi:hypothetical protein
MTQNNDPKKRRFIPVTAATPILSWLLQTILVGVIQAAASFFTLIGLERWWEKQQKKKDDNEK